jgi:hypothetical protein
MKNCAADRSVWLLLLVILFSSSGILFAGPEPLSINGKDYSKEVVPVEKSWCETPKRFEIRIGAPGWLAGISGESGVLGLVDSADVSFSQLFRHLTHVPIVLSAELRYGRWEIFGDGQYMEVGVSSPTASNFKSAAGFGRSSAGGGCEPTLFLKALLIRLT